MANKKISLLISELCSLSQNIHRTLYTGLKLDTYMPDSVILKFQVQLV